MEGVVSSGVRDGVPDPSEMEATFQLPEGSSVMEPPGHAAAIKAITTVTALIFMMIRR